MKFKDWWNSRSYWLRGGIKTSSLILGLYLLSIGLLFMFASLIAYLEKNGGSSIFGILLGPELFTLLFFFIMHFIVNVPLSPFRIFFFVFSGEKIDPFLYNGEDFIEVLTPLGWIAVFIVWFLIGAIISLIRSRLKSSK